MPLRGWKTIFKHGLAHCLWCECYSFDITCQLLVLLCVCSALTIGRSSTLSPRISFTCTPLALITTRGTFVFRIFSSSLPTAIHSNFTQFYSTKSERDRNLRKEYETQMEYRKHLQAFIDRWRYNANRAAQAQSKIKILEKVRLDSLSMSGLS